MASSTPIIAPVSSTSPQPDDHRFASPQPHTQTHEENTYIPYYIEKRTHTTHHHRYSILLYYSITLPLHSITLPLHYHTQPLTLQYKETLVSEILYTNPDTKPPLSSYG